MIQGTRTYSNGSKYVGEFKDGRRHGQGTYTISSGIKFVGEYKNGKEWNGTLYNKNGNRLKKMIQGTWVNGK